MKCRQIALALDLLSKNDWKIKEQVSGWTETDLVIYFEKQLTDKMRAELKTIPGLEFHRIDKDLHYGKEDVFICNKCKVAISFPLN